MPFKLYIYLGAFVTYCDPILVHIPVCTSFQILLSGNDVESSFALATRIIKVRTILLNGKYKVKYYMNIGGILPAGF